MDDIARAHRASLYPGLLLYRGILWLALPCRAAAVVAREARSDLSTSLARTVWFLPPQTQGAVWFHTVSAGETIAAAPSIRAMAKGDTPTMGRLCWLPP